METNWREYERAWRRSLYARGTSESTIKTYEKSLHKPVAWAEQDRFADPTAMTGPDLEGFFEHLRRTPTRKGTRLSPSTIAMDCRDAGVLQLAGRLRGQPQQHAQGRRAEGRGATGGCVLRRGIAPLVRDDQREGLRPAARLRHQTLATTTPGNSPARCAAAGIPDDIAFATKNVLGRRMLDRALDAGVPAAWVTADEFYGGDRALRRDLQGRRLGYVLAVAKSHRVNVGGLHGIARADHIAATLGRRAWNRYRGGDGAKGRRDYDWPGLR